MIIHLSRFFPKSLSISPSLTICIHRSPCLSSVPPLSLFLFLSNQLILLPSIYSRLLYLPPFCTTFLLRLSFLSISPPLPTPPSDSSIISSLPLSFPFSFSIFVHLTTCLSHSLQSHLTDYPLVYMSSLLFILLFFLLAGSALLLLPTRLSIHLSLYLYSLFLPSTPFPISSPYVSISFSLLTPL